MNKFKVGDKVKVATDVYDDGSKGCPKRGDILDVVELCASASKGVWVDNTTVEVSGINHNQEDFTLFVDKTFAKPILEERKVGKIEMDLFDSGFPNAILEVAKVMTWAGQNKGYKPHDWTNLPNAEVEFSAAASRHKMKSLIQKVDGVFAQDRVDEESGIVHLAHEAFNVLAQLELVLRGKIK